MKEQVEYTYKSGSLGYGINVRYIAVMLDGGGYWKCRNVGTNSDKFSEISTWKPVKCPEAYSETELQVLELGITICRHEKCTLLGLFRGA